MKNYIKEGDRIKWNNGTGSAVASGDLVVVGSLLGVATGDIANGEDGILALEGVFTLPKVASASANAFTQGEKLIFDVSTAKFEKSTFTPATGDVSGAAVAFEAATSTATTATIKLPGLIGSIT